MQGRFAKTVSYSNLHKMPSSDMEACKRRGVRCMVEYEEKICPIMSTPTKMVKCLRDKCAVWITFGDGGCTLGDRRRFFKELH